MERNEMNIKREPRRERIKEKVKELGCRHSWESVNSTERRSFSFLSFMFHWDTLIKNEIPALLAAISLLYCTFQVLEEIQGKGKRKGTLSRTHTFNAQHSHGQKIRSLKLSNITRERECFCTEYHRRCDAVVGTRSPANTNSSANGLDWLLVIKKGTVRQSFHQIQHCGKNVEFPIHFQRDPLWLKQLAVAAWGGWSWHRVDFFGCHRFDPKKWLEQPWVRVIHRHESEWYKGIPLRMQWNAFFQSKCSVGANCLPKLRWAVEHLWALWSRLLEAAPVGAENGSHVVSLPCYQFKNKGNTYLTYASLLHLGE